MDRRLESTGARLKPPLTEEELKAYHQRLMEIDRCASKPNEFVARYGEKLPRIFISWTRGQGHVKPEDLPSELEDLLPTLTEHERQLVYRTHIFTKRQYLREILLGLRQQQGSAKFKSKTRESDLAWMELWNDCRPECKSDAEADKKTAAELNSKLLPKDHVAPDTVRSARRRLLGRL